MPSPPPPECSVRFALCHAVIPQEVASLTSVTFIKATTLPHVVGKYTQPTFYCLTILSSKREFVPLKLLHTFIFPV